VVECTLAENAALDGKHSSSGGAIFVAQGEGTIRIARSRLVRNYVTGYKADGGALSLGSGFAATVNDTEISANNVSGVTACGGALRSSGSVSVWRSSIAENKVFSHGESGSSRCPAYDGCVVKAVLVQGAMARRTVARSSSRATAFRHLTAATICYCSNAGIRRCSAAQRVATQYDMGAAQRIVHTSDSAKSAVRDAALTAVAGMRHSAAWVLAQRQCEL
jgi:hypothetical protein